MTLYGIAETGRNGEMEKGTCTVCGAKVRYAGSKIERHGPNGEYPWPEFGVPDRCPGSYKPATEWSARSIGEDGPESLKDLLR